MARTLWFVVLLCILFVFPSCSLRRAVQCNCGHCGFAVQRDGYGFILDEEPAPEVERLVYIALGDSVSEGFGIWSAEDRHTSVFFAMLQERGFANEYVNMAVSGFTTADLLLLLSALEPEMLDTMRYASVITLNIGGNNILAPFWGHLPDINEIQRITDETVGFATEAWELAVEIMEFASQSRETVEEVLEFASEVIYFADNFRFLDIFRINEMVDAAPPIIDGAMDVFAEVNALEAAVAGMFERATRLEVLDLISLFSGSFPSELEAEFQSSIRMFSYEFAEILTWLEDNAPDAVVVVNTVFNPLPTNIIGMPVGLADESQRIIQAVNRIIYEESRQRGFIVSDVYSSLSHRLDMMNLNFDIIHPNPQGHYAIAQLNFIDFLQGVVSP